MITFDHCDTNRQGIKEYTVSIDDNFIVSDLGDNSPIIEINGKFFIAVSIVKNITGDFVGTLRYGRGRGRLYTAINDQLINDLTDHYQTARKISDQRLTRQTRIDTFAIALIDLIS